MSAYTKIQKDFSTVSRHTNTSEVGTGYFDQVSMAVSGGTSSTTALEGLTETEHFANNNLDSEKMVAN